MKTCSKCGVLKECSEFYQTTLLNGPHAGEHRILSRCKPCMREDLKVRSRTCKRCGESKLADQFKSSGPNICLTCLSLIPETKICTKCGQDKPAKDFGRRLRGLGPLESWCRRCYSDEASRRRRKDPEKFRAAYNKWRLENPDKARQATNTWIQANREHVRSTARLRKIRKLKTDPQFKLAHYLGCRLRASVKKAKTQKSGKTLKLLGCSISELREHLQSLFKPGMTWENYGPIWHVDHIKPVAKFDLTDPEQQRICFHWTNLQPLFAAENIRKSDSYED